ncbi:unnamed protein product [Pseudo-nitzschia multistriata]|uniref:Uncharacterized protein n=1 Tax=Pseudo-nitzschia multistriata TaxID=183589 RepID=A0A448Z3R7_9STRA|nr:unnamed protein product [Pseudo-nitzschia multistriata]
MKLKMPDQNATETSQRCSGTYPGLAFVTRRRSSSTGDLQKFTSEGHWYEEILNNAVAGGTNGATAAGAARRKSLLENFKNTYTSMNLNKSYKTGGENQRRSSIIKFPLEALTADSSVEFKNPDLFSEVHSMAFMSASIFALAEVRKAARDGRIDTDGLDIISTPVLGGAIIKTFLRNKEFFLGELKDADYDFLRSVAQSTNMDSSEESGEYCLSKAEDSEHNRKENALKLINSVSIDYFGDDNIELECMYMVTRIPSSKQITLIFKGSTTLQDWIKDSKVIVSDIENPVGDRPEQLQMIGVHLGFREYLYGESTTVSTENSSRSLSLTSLPDEGVEATIESFEENKVENPCTDDDNISPTANVSRESLTSTSAILKYLGLDVSSLKGKQNNLQVDCAGYSTR